MLPYEGMQVLYCRDGSENPGEIVYVRQDAKKVGVKLKDDILNNEFGILYFTLRSDKHYVLVGHNYGFLKFVGIDPKLSLV